VNLQRLARASRSPRQPSNGSATAPLVAVSAVALAALACGPQEPATDTDGPWVGTITTEGNVTTVVNESGSVWGGTARLVEEASIGVESGAEEYMFGGVSSVYATDDRIYVVDRQAPAVRVYGHDGDFIRTLGREGQGPGEYQSPSVLAVHPASGRVFVFDTLLDRVNVYSGAGEPEATWPVPDIPCCGRRMWAPMSDRLWLPVKSFDQEMGERREGVQAHGPDGPQGGARWIPEIRYERITFDAEGSTVPVPFAASVDWTPTPDGDLVAGASDSYSFEVHEPDGSALVVERFWEPVPVPAEHREWQRRFVVAQFREIGMRGLNWDGSGIPAHKPAFDFLLAARSGEVWVEREGPSERLPNCVDDPLEAGSSAAGANPCWRSRYILDAFARDGRYLGEVETPSGLWGSALRLFIDGRMVVAVVEDEAGTIMVKRYRLVLPGER